VIEPEATDVDVHALHQGYLKGLRQRGGKVATNAEVTALSKSRGMWNAETSVGAFSAPVVVNAAGAWCDEVARQAGVRPCGLVPKRRTAFTVDPPAGLNISAWPLTIDIDEQFYFKPESGLILLSPADETPSPPCDSRPEDIDVALAVDRIQTATMLTVPRITHKWAGLRSFVADKTPVLGMDDEADGFFWLAGQGGYGIQTAPAMARATAALITSGTLPEDFAEQGLRESDLAPRRLR
jgi:D-arginine dehydrogenase